MDQQPGVDQDQAERVEKEEQEAVVLDAASENRLTDRERRQAKHYLRSKRPFSLPRLLA